MDYQQPDLSVITVNYNGFHDTCEFIDSWAATVFSVSYEMIVIDNVKWFDDHNNRNHEDCNLSPAHKSDEA